MQHPPGLSDPTPPRNAGGEAAAIVALTLGLSVVAACVLLPPTGQVRRLTYEQTRLEAEVAHAERQIRTNERFLRQLADGGANPNLRERLARRQHGYRPPDVLDLPVDALRSQDHANGKGTFDRSAFAIPSLPTPPAITPHEPAGGFWTRWVERTRLRVWTLGGGLLLIAFGLLGGTSRRPSHLRRTVPA